MSDGLKSSPDGEPAEACNHHQNHVNHLHNDQRRVTFDLNHKPNDNHDYYENDDGAVDDDGDVDGAPTPDNDRCDICRAPQHNASMARCTECAAAACSTCMSQDNRTCRLCSEMLDGLSSYHSDCPDIDDTTLRSMRLDGGVLNGWSSDKYVADELHSTAPPALQGKMRHMPEEFYSHCGLAVLRPRSALQFLNLHSRWSKLRRVQLSWDLMELYSGSARVSGQAHTEGLCVGLPTDHRYGWDLKVAHHRWLVEQIVGLFRPKILLAAPECRAWSRSSNVLDPVAKAELRRRETPMLAWLVKVCKRQAQLGYGVVVEQPHGADSWRLSPLAQLERLQGFTRSRVSQCMHGAMHPQLKLPVKKDASLASNLRLRQTIRTCHVGHQHGILQGRCPRTGLCFTTLAATYPRGLAKAMVADFKRFIEDDEFTESRQALLSHQEVPLWTCRRCANGPRTLDHVKHTMVPGECRLGSATSSAGAHGATGAGSGGTLHTTAVGGRAQPPSVAPAKLAPDLKNLQDGFSN